MWKDDTLSRVTSLQGNAACGLRRFHERPCLGQEKLRKMDSVSPFMYFLKYISPRSMDFPAYAEGVF